VRPYFRGSATIAPPLGTEPILAADSGGRRLITPKASIELGAHKNLMPASAHAISGRATQGRLGEHEGHPRATPDHRSCKPRRPI